MIVGCSDVGKLPCVVSQSCMCGAEEKFVLESPAEIEQKHYEQSNYCFDLELVTNNEDSK